MLFPHHLSADDRYTFSLYRRVVGGVAAFASWVVTALAAMVALIIAHLDIMRPRGAAAANGLGITMVSWRAT